LAGPETAAALLAAFFTIVLTIFIAELTDKDALLLLTLATRIKPWTAFAAGAVAFTISSAIIVTIGYFLTRVVPIFWIRIAGGFVMIGFAFWQYFHEEGKEKKRQGESDEKKLLRQTLKQSSWSIFLGAVSLLILLDLAGDATEVLTIVYVARFSNALLVFFGAVVALISASAVETILGNRLAKILSAKRIRIFSLLVLLLIGSIIIVTTIA
jgi:putative Ca2+/H+ antiporter (TMEM165/GDT1 family)